MSEKIRPHHLQRKAILYIRQSSPYQVLHNLESQKLQYAMEEHLRRLGWQQIEIIDEDLGRSAAGTATRAGFERMVAQVCLGQVGAVAAREVSRFARNSREWQQLVEVCRVVDTVLIDQETVYAPRQSNDLVRSRIGGHSRALAPSDRVRHYFPHRILNGGAVAGESIGEVPFQEHLEQLQSFLGHRNEAVERIQGLLNAQRRPLEDLQDRPALSRQFEDCFFTLPEISRDRSLLRGQLQEAHWACGFRPRRMPGMHNDLVDPAEMMMRGFHFWRQTRWPGRNGRVRYAQTLFNLYVLRYLELLTMRLWDAGPNDARNRLPLIQRVLDQLWRTSPPDQPVLVRDARWLIPLAQSPTTDELAPYFTVARQIAESLEDEDRIEISKACVQTAGGHLRSQLRHCSMEQGVPIDEHDLTLSTRNSNALDFAMLIQGLVPLLEAYERARLGGDRARVLALAGAVCQGVSADPELFVNRVELLAPYSMIEHLFITTDHGGRALYTPIGLRHVQLLQAYTALISRLAKPLHEDCAHFRPVPGAYSPYGVIFGFSSNLTEHMAFKMLQADTPTHFSVEDVFADEEASADKLTWVSGWRKLPHIAEDVQKLFEYPQQFAEAMFDRIEHALRRRMTEAGTHAGSATGRIHILPGDGSGTDLPIRYIGSSDTQMLAANRAHSYEESRLLRDRQEGMFLVSYESAGGWTAISKDILTDLLGAGRDVKIAGLPSAASEVLRLMSRDLAVPRET